MFTSGIDAIFMTRPFWTEMKVPQNLVLQIYSDYLGNQNMTITSRLESHCSTDASTPM